MHILIALITCFIEEWAWGTLRSQTVSGPAGDDLSDLEETAMPQGHKVLDLLNVQNGFSVVSDMKS